MNLLQTLGRAGLSVSLLGAATLVFAQNSGRFDGSKSLAADYLKSNQFDRAAGKLEEVWEQDQSDLSVAENLALAYLNGDDRRYHKEVQDKALKLMDKSIGMGGKASFLVRHLHDKVPFMTSALNYCAGRLSISPGKMVFVVQAVKGVEEHPFEIDGSTEKLSVTDADKSGEFKIKTKAKNYALTPRNGLKADSDLMLSLIRQHVGPK